MDYALPAGVVNTNSAYFYVVDGANPLGPMIKEPSDQTLVIIDYTKLSTALMITDFQFRVDVASNPQLVISFADTSSPLNNLLHFLLSGGIAGQQYKLSITVTSGGHNRVDVLTINIPSSGDCCAQINPVPALLTELPLGEPTTGYVNTGVRFFWGAAPPVNPNVLDQWYNTDNQTLYEWVNDGTEFFWEVIMSEGLVEDAPTDNIQYARYNGFWVPNPIQQDAPADSQHYVRWNNGWLLLPDNPIATDAPNDGQYYARRNHAWQVTPPGAQPSFGLPLQDGIADPGSVATFARGDHVHPTDTSRYSVSNPANYQTDTQVAAATALLMPKTGGTFSGGVAFTAGAIFASPVNLNIGGGTNKQVLSATATPGLVQWADLPAVLPPATVSDTAPSSPVAGALWWDSVGGQMYIWYVDATSSQWVPVVNEVGAYLSLSGGVVSGPIDLKAQTVVQTGATLAINRALGENVAVTLSASITAITVTGWPAVGFTGKMRLIVSNGGAFTMAGWPAGTIWPGGVAPMLTSGAGKRDIILLMSDDGGTTIYGSIVGQDYR